MVLLKFFACSVCSLMAVTGFSTEGRILRHYYHFKKSSTTSSKPRASSLILKAAAVKMVFSDIDGSLIHYPKQQSDDDDGVSTFTSSDDEDGERILFQLPASATGMRGIISSQTLGMCQELRRKRGLRLVLISGMRTSTLLGRLPYLPKADAYCTESGGRIFYPTDPLEVDGAQTNSDEPFPFQFATPVFYQGASPDDLAPFGLREDFEWRQRLEKVQAAGNDGYSGNEVSSDRCDQEDDSVEAYEECLIDYDNRFGFPLKEEVIPVESRTGLLWKFARELQTKHGLVLDTKSYSTCFRVNKKHQSPENEYMFDALLTGMLEMPRGLEMSTNLGCIDVYPSCSGKRNCCSYLSEKYGVNMRTESVCLVDDDNDMELAVACLHAFIPGMASISVVENMMKYPKQFTQTFVPGRIEMTKATDAALENILRNVRIKREHP